jgi:Protein of unknown function (DUF3617)
VTVRLGLVAGLAAALAAGAACNAAQDGPGKAAALQGIDPGLYAITITTVSVETDDAETTAAMRPLIGRVEPGRECHGGRPAVVGGNAGAGCSFTRIDDRGTTVSRTAICPASQPDLTSSMTVSGTRSRDRYDYRIRLTSRKPDGSIAIEVVTREEGRRLGPCPDGRPATQVNSFF